ncbi:MAG: hypothetical protein CMH53_02040, partial [Myxococcales bacterium]|nr:hypothetical protein [Myxococcales bacterium]
MTCFRSLPSRQLAVWSLIVFASLWTAGCGDSGNSSNGAATGADAGESDIEDVSIEIPVLEPKIMAECTKCTEPVVGNVPLEVTFTLDMGDNDPADYLIGWDFGDGDKIEPSADTASSELLTVAHTFKYKGLFPTRATVTWRKNLKVSKTVTQEVEVLQPSDIYLSPITLLSPTTLFPNDVVKLQFDILNDGESVKKAVKTCFYLSEDDKLDDKDLFCGDMDHPEGIASGLTGTSKISYDTAKPAEFTIPETVSNGNWFILVKVDCEDVAPELNKQDNVGFATSLIQIDTSILAPADLVVTEPVFDSEETYSPGETATYQVKLKNEGEGEAKNFEFGVFLSKDKVLAY